MVVTWPHVPGSRFRRKTFNVNDQVYNRLRLSGGTSRGAPLTSERAFLKKEQEVCPERSAAAVAALSRGPLLFKANDRKSARVSSSSFMKTALYLLRNWESRRKALGGGGGGGSIQREALCSSPDVSAGSVELQIGRIAGLLDSAPPAVLLPLLD